MRPTLPQYLKSLPVRGGRAEELRQERILQSAKELMKPIAEERLLEMRCLVEKKDLTEMDQRRLDFFKRRYPEEDLNMPCLSG